MAEILALCAAFFFALAATLQQKGALGIGEVFCPRRHHRVRRPAGLARNRPVGRVRCTVSVFNPLVSILIGTLLLDERLSEPTWHKLVAYAGLALALAGAVAISRATEGDPEAGSSDVRRSPLTTPAT